MRNAAPIHPTEIIPETIVASSRERGWNGLIVERSLMPPMETALPALTQHLILFHFGSQPVKQPPRQISRFDRHAFEGAFYYGDIFIQPAGIPSFHSWTTFDDALMFTVEQEFLRRVAEETCEANPARVELVSEMQIRDERIEQIAVLSKHEIENDNPGGKLFGDSLANLLALQLLRNHSVFEMRLPQYKGGLPKNKLRRVTDYINENLHAQLSLKTLADEAGLSSYHFARLFKQSTGRAPHQFVNAQRVERAKKLLIETDLTVAEIAFTLGFTDQSHFTKIFRRTVGETPSSFQSKAR